MNVLEQKCRFLMQTPQSRWYELRYKALCLQLQNMGIRALPISTIFPRASDLNMIGYFFKYDNEIYFFFINKEKDIINFVQLERTNSSYPYILSAHIVLSSDDDSRTTYMPIFCLVSGFNNTADLFMKCNSLLP